jgi:hypothetical protein
MVNKKRQLQYSSSQHFLPFLEIMKTLPVSLVLAGISSSLVLTRGVNPVPLAVLIGNLPQNNDNSATLISPNNIKALAFTLPAGNNYSLDNAILRLNNYETGDIPLVQIRNDVGQRSGQYRPCQFQQSHPSRIGTL